MMNARTKLFPQLSKLQGKLQLVMSQVSSQAEGIQTNAEKDAQPLLYYQDSTSEDEQLEDELIPSHSEYDDYRFSDEDDEDESTMDDEEMIEEDDDEDDHDNNGKLQEDHAMSGKKEVLSFKKSKANLSKNSLLKNVSVNQKSNFYPKVKIKSNLFENNSQNKKASEDESDEEDDEDDDEDDEEQQNGFHFDEDDQESNGDDKEEEDD
jgi:hypothetical protein